MSEDIGKLLNPKINRRTLLKVGAALGAAVAVGASLNNFKEVSAATYGEKAPDPVPTDPGVKVIYTVCQNCHGRCGLMATVKDGVLVKLDGNPYHPNNMDPDEMLKYSADPEEAKKTPGRLCLKGQAGIQVVYDPYRVKQPMKRVGARGSGKWQAISWDQALDEIAAKLKPLQDTKTLINPSAPELGPVANQLGYSPGRTLEGDFTSRVWGSGFGTINHRLDHTSICEVSHHVGNRLITWDEKANAGRKDHFKPDILEAKYIIILGANYFEANFPMLALSRKLVEFRKRGGKYVVVDPRFSNSAAHAHRWLPIRPGTDAALALGLVRWIIDNKRYDEKYLQNANKEAASADGEKTWADATYLVVIDPTDPDNRRYLKADAIGGSKDNYVAWDGTKAVEVKSGAPVEGMLDTGDIEVAGKKCNPVFTLAKARVQEKTIAQYAEICGIPESTIATVASEFAAAGKKAVANTYRGVVQHTNGVYNHAACMWLNTLMGNYDWKGGNTTGGGGWGTGTGVVDVSKVPGGVSAKGIRIDRTAKSYEKDAPNLFKQDRGYPARRPWFPFGTYGNYQEVIPSAADGYPYPLKALITYWNAWPYSTPALRQVFEDYVKDETRLPLFVSISKDMGEVATFADYVLPDSSYLEKWSIPGMTPTILTRATSIQQPVVGKLDGKMIGGPDFVFDPNAKNDYTPVLPNTRSVIDIHIELAKRLGLPGVGDKGFEDGKPINNAWDWIKRQFENLSKASGKSIEEIITKGGVFEDGGNEYTGNYLKYIYGNIIRIYLEPLATTKDSMTGKYFDGLAKYDPIKHADDSPVDDREFNFNLITYKSVRHGQARTANLPWLMLLNPENFVELNSSDARSLGVETGDLVKIISASNSAGVVGKVKVIEGLRPGVVAVSHHYGHWEQGSRPYLADGKAADYDPTRGAGLQANPVMRLDNALKNVSLQDKIGCSVSFNDTRVRIEKV